MKRLGSISDRYAVRIWVYDMEFRKYIHIERFGTDEVQGIELGSCWIFPKIDGTNASVWNENGSIAAGSRNRELTLENDNAGFASWAFSSPNIENLVENHSDKTFFGEWLVPHSLKTYRGDAWRKFYVFDVMNFAGDYLPYNICQPILEEFGIDYIPPICSMKNADYSGLLRELDANTFLIEDGKGKGEGIVIKNYYFKNRFGRQSFAKIVTNEFKEKHVKEMGVNDKACKQMVEQEICDNYVTKHLIDKVYAKIINESDGWNSRYIPRLLSTVFYDLVNEEMWDIVKTMKNPTVSFKTLNMLTIMKIKDVRTELF
jgi:RNA ligase